MSWTEILELNDFTGVIELENFRRKALITEKPQNYMRKRNIISELRKGDKIKIYGWKGPREIIEIYEKGDRWFAGLLSRDDGEIEYYVITEDQITGIGRDKP